jgi:hypothetical protein
MKPFNSCHRLCLLIISAIFAGLCSGCASDAWLLDRANSEAVSQALEAQKLRAAKMDEANQRDARELEPKFQELLTAKPSGNASDSTGVLKSSN